jgi:hypothetical protein
MLFLPFYNKAIQPSKDALLREQLFTFRTAIDKYTFDRKMPPEGLQDLVDGGYLPADPFTESREGTPYREW